MTNPQMFSVYDSAADRYTDPFVAPTIEWAIREFRRSANQPGKQISEYPQDYTLFHIGEFNPESGVLEPQVPRSLGVAIQFVESPDIQPEVTDA